MKKFDYEVKQPAKLRMRAEEFLNKNLSAIKKVPPRDVRNLFEDLQIYQMELEEQNHALYIAQRELQETCARYSDLYDFAPVGYFTLDEKGVILEANLTGASLLNAKKNSLIGRYFHNFICDENVLEFKSIFEKLLKTKNSQSCESKLITHDGQGFYVQVKCSVDKLFQNNQKQIRVIVTDIDARKKFEDKIAQGEEKLKPIFENANDEIVCLDNEGRIVHVNTKVKDIIGHQADEIIGKKYCDLKFLRKEDIHQIDAFMKKALSEGYSGLEKVRFMRKDGSEVIVEASTSVIKEQGEVRNILAVVRDVTERERKVKEKVRELAQLQQVRKMEAMDTFAGGIAHELSDLLSLILGNAELALDGIPSSDPVRKNLEELCTLCLRAGDVVKHILSFSRDTRTELNPVDINKVLRETIKSVQSACPAGIKIKYHISSKSHMIYADATQMEQVLLNLCFNAFQAMVDKDNVLEITLDSIVLDKHTVCVYHNLNPGKYVRLTVKDNGHGMDQNVMDRVFDPYFTTWDMNGNIGMGLSVTYGIVKKHGGDITVSSAPGKGSVFHVLLPVIQSGFVPTLEVVQSDLIR